MPDHPSCPTPFRARLHRVGIPALLAGIVMAGCVPTITETALAPDNVYVCRDNKAVRVVRAPDGMAAEVSLEGQRVLQQRADSAAQEKYSNGPTTLYLDGEKAV